MLQQYRGIESEIIILACGTEQEHILEMMLREESFEVAVKPFADAGSPSAQHVEA